MVAHVALNPRVRVAPLLRCLAKEGNVEEVGLVGVGEPGLSRSDRGRDQMGFDRIGVDTIVQLGERAVEVPRQREAAVLVLLQPLEFPDEVDFERRTDPHPKLECDVPMRVGAAITPRTRTQPDRMGLLHPFLHAQFVTVQPGLAFNYGEFAGIKRRVVDAFPDTKELDGISVAQPVGDEELAVFGRQHVGERNEISERVRKNRYRGALDIDRGLGGFAHAQRAGAETV